MQRDAEIIVPAEANSHRFRLRIENGSADARALAGGQRNQGFIESRRERAASAIAFDLEPVVRVVDMVNRADSMNAGGCGRESAWAFGKIRLIAGIFFDVADTGFFVFVETLNFRLRECEVEDARGPNFAGEAI